MIKILLYVLVNIPLYKLAFHLDPNNDVSKNSLHISKDS